MKLESAPCRRVAVNGRLAVNMRVLGGRRASLYVMNVEDINKTLQTPREQLVVVLRLGVDH